MKIFSTQAIAALALALPLSALPADNYVVHETRAPTGTGPSNAHLRWKRGLRADPDAIIPLRIGLAQTNLHLGHQKLMDVSHPSSDSFGKHFTSEEVHDLFAPSHETISSVQGWLVEMGINETDIRQYTNKGWLSVDLPVSTVEDLFRTQYHEHEKDGMLKIGCDEYHVPKHLSGHIDYIVPGIKLSPPLKKRTLEARGSIHNIQNKLNWQPKTIPPGQAHWKAPPQTPNLSFDLFDCARNFTALCYRALYHLPFASIPVPGNEAAVYESGDFYAQEDIDEYFKTYTPYIKQGTHPKLEGVDGGTAPVPKDSPLNGGESDIDIDIVQSLIWPQTMVLYQVDDLHYETNSSVDGFLNTWLDALDGSYCHKTDFGITGDSPGIDPTYPDPGPGGYPKSEMCGAYKPTNVVSISYGESELDTPKKYQQRQCNEFLKLGLQGTTVLVSSGDYGVGIGPGNDSCLSAGGQTQTIYNPGAPVGCPYLTAVGATQLDEGTTIFDAEAALQTPLGPGAELFASGGGFSNYFPLPDYQKKAVQQYFAQHDPGHPYYEANADASNIGANGGIYNRGGRGIPDISANGANFRAFRNGTNYHWFGTSLSAPLWNAMITLINQERALQRKKPVGFINPVLYENTWALTDIKKGSNPNCGSSGFQAVSGWDPITGLGTPKYEDLLSLWLRMP